MRKIIVAATLVLGLAAGAVPAQADPAPPVEDPPCATSTIEGMSVVTNPDGATCQEMVFSMESIVFSLRSQVAGQEARSRDLQWRLGRAHHRVRRQATMIHRLRSELRAASH